MPISFGEKRGESQDEDTLNVTMRFQVLDHQSIDVGQPLKVANRMVRHVSGGLSMVSVLSSMFFAGLSGSAPATTATIGKIMIPEMERRGYTKRFATSLAVSAGPLGQIIPPSIPFIVWGVIAEQSISKLFLAGVIPGIVDGLAYMTVCYLLARRVGIPRLPRASFKEWLQPIYHGKWALFAPVLILGGIYGGVFTPTAASVMAVVYGLITGLWIYRGFGFRELGINRLLLTHASESVSTLSIDQQVMASEWGAYVEHSFFAATPACPTPISLAAMADMIRAVGCAHVILTSGFRPGDQRQPGARLRPISNGDAFPRIQ